MYYQLGSHKRLNEIVMAGSHDAGITAGGANAKTQSKDILGQAKAGVRVFDLRVAGFGNKHRVSLKTFHSPKLTKPKDADDVLGLGVPSWQARKGLKVSKVGLGTEGEDLVKILRDARSFVEKFENEFLILKFDKCLNWSQIAALCVQELDGTLYKDSGNLNKKTLFDLKGKVVVVFDHDAWCSIDEEYRGRGGILGFRNLHDGGTYDPGYDGIQYYGKGGTGLIPPALMSIAENYSRQRRLLQKGAATNRHVMGMMYWTTTGVFGNIKQRNAIMWRSPFSFDLVELWMNGMGTHVKARIPDGVDPASDKSAIILKRFLPNIVMIDFADENKCRTIWNLNKVTNFCNFSEVERKLKDLGMLPSGRQLPFARRT